MKTLIVAALAAVTLGLSAQSASADWVNRPVWRQWHYGYRTVIVPYRYATYHMRRPYYRRRIAAIYYYAE